MSRFLFALYSLKTRLVSLVTGKPVRDDFDWRFYTDHYRAELEMLDKNHSRLVRPGDYEFASGCLSKKLDILPIHPNHRLVYETILQLSPETIMEMGCGGGDHLSNLSVLAPAIRLMGVDLSDRQLDLLRSRHPDLKAEVRQFDLASDPDKNDLARVDLSYTQAVLMHIRDREAYLRALTNVFRVARKHVVLMENWTRHDFLPDILDLFERKRLGWEKLYLYYRESEEYRKPHLLVASNVELPQYPVLTDYAILRDRVES